MSVAAPLRIPVEIVRDRLRWFRLAEAVSEGGLYFVSPLPAELEGPITASFHLPEDPLPIVLDGRAVSLDGEAHENHHEAAGARAIRFIRPDEESLSRIARYVEERVPA